MQLLKAFKQRYKHKLHEWGRFGVLATATSLMLGWKVEMPWISAHSKDRSRSGSRLEGSSCTHTRLARGDSKQDDDGNESSHRYRQIPPPPSAFYMNVQEEQTC